MFSSAQTLQAAQLLARCRTRGRTLAFAESCTGGLLSALLTEIPGASDVFLGSVVSYANAAKMMLLDVPEPLLRTHGAVSPECGKAMAIGALRRFGSTHALAITGIAGPGGGSDQKPVGTVVIAQADGRHSSAETYHFTGDRREVRAQALSAALSLLESVLFA